MGLGSWESGQSETENLLPTSALPQTYGTLPLPSSQKVQRLATTWTGELVQCYMKDHHGGKLASHTSPES